MIEFDCTLINSNHIIGGNRCEGCIFCGHMYFANTKTVQGFIYLEEKIIIP